MAAYQNGIAEFLNGDVDYLTNGAIKCILVGTATAYTYAVDDTFVDMAGANDVIDAELTGVSGYTRGFGGAGRKALGTKTVTIVDASDRVEMRAAALTWTALGAGDTIDAAVIAVELTNDAASNMFSHHDLTNTPTNGGDITVNWAGGGNNEILYYTC
jgi:hypothetical protein